MERQPGFVAVAQLLLFGVPLGDKFFPFKKSSLVNLDFQRCCCCKGPFFLAPTGIESFDSLWRGCENDGFVS